jgi:hypothetical protein
MLLVGNLAINFIWLGVDPLEAVEVRLDFKISSFVLVVIAAYARYLSLLCQLIFYANCISVACTFANILEYVQCLLSANIAHSPRQ